jgi:hypothetical protein
MVILPFALRGEWECADGSARFSLIEIEFLNAIYTSSEATLRQQVRAIAQTARIAAH